MLKRVGGQGEPATGATYMVHNMAKLFHLVHLFILLTQ